MNYTPGRNCIRSIPGTALNNSELTIEEKAEGYRVSGTCSMESDIFYSLSCKIDLNIIQRYYVGLPFGLYVTVTNNGQKNLYVYGNGMKDVSGGKTTTIRPAETITINQTGIVASASLLSILFKTENLGDAVDFTHSLLPFHGFGEPPETVTLPPELTTAAGSTVTTDSIQTN